MIRIPVIKLLGYNVFSGKKDFFYYGFKGVVNTISPHSYIIARKDSLFREALMASDIIIPDGIGIDIAARFVAKKLKYNLNRTDLIPEIISIANKKNKNIYLLGGKPKVAEIAAKN